MYRWQVRAVRAFVLLSLFSPLEFCIQFLPTPMTHRDGKHWNLLLKNYATKVCLRVSVIRIFNFKLLMLRLSSWWFDDIWFYHQTLGRLIRYHYIKFILRISDGKGGRGFHSKGLCQYAAS